MRTSTLRRFSALRAVAVLALASFALAACDLAGPGSDATPDTTYAESGSKLRHAHLMDRALRKPDFGETMRGDDDEYIGLIVGLDKYRILTRYGTVDPYRILTRYQEMEQFRILTRYEYQDVFVGFAIWVEEQGIEEILAVMEGDDEIVWIEPDISVRSIPLGTASVTSRGVEVTAWGTSRIGAGSLSGQGVDLFVVDTGVNTTDVASADGYDFVEDIPAHRVDVDGHGTHIAATAAALANARGVVGVAPGARVHDLRVLTGAEEDDDDDSAVDLSRAIAAVEHVTSYKLRHPNTPVVVNFSLGAEVGTTVYNALDEAIVASTQAGVTFVVAAGNDAIDVSTVTPAHVHEAITVGAYGPDGRFATFSNRGRLIDILAPGVDILSMASGSSDLAFMSGTSMAAAHVSGAVAAFLSENRNASPAQVEYALKESGAAGITDVPGGTISTSVHLGEGGLLATQVPPFFQYALTSGGDITFDADDIFVGLEDGGLANANLFANGNLKVHSGSLIEGFGYYGGEAVTYGDFQPNYNPTGLAVTSQQRQIDVPGFHAPTYRSLATRVHPGSLSINGTVELGTREHPVIIYVGRNLSVTSSTTLRGYGIFIVRGDIKINAPMQTVGAATMGETTLGLYAQGDVSFNGLGTEVAAQIFSGSDVEFEESVTLYGSVTAHGNLNVSHPDVRIYYRPASPALTAPLWPVSN